MRSLLHPSLHVPAQGHDLDRYRGKNLVIHHATSTVFPASNVLKITILFCNQRLGKGALLLALAVAS